MIATNTDQVLKAVLESLRSQLRTHGVSLLTAFDRDDQKLWDDLVRGIARNVATAAVGSGIEIEDCENVDQELHRALEREQAVAAKLHDALEAVVVVDAIGEAAEIAKRALEEVAVMP